MSSRDLILEISDLALRASDDRLRAEERDRFNELLASSDEACRTLLLCGILDAELAVRSHEESGQDRALEAITLGEKLSPRQERPAMFGKLPRWFLRGAAACLILFTLFLGVGLYFVRLGGATNLAQRQPQPVASLASISEAVFSSDAPTVGGAFNEGDEIALRGGEAHVSMASGAEFILKSPAVLKFCSANRVELRRGVLVAHVAEWGSGFTVDTSAMRVVDLGTRFAVSAAPEDVEAHVLQGQIRVQPLASTLHGRRSVLLSEGEAIRVGAGANEPTLIAAEQDRFPESREEFWPFKPISMFNTGIALSKGDEDSHWRITRGPIGGSFSGPQFAVVCEPDVRYAVNEPLRSQWLSFARDVRPGGLRNSVFTFETTFDLTGFDPSTVIVAAQILADNGVRAVRINGEPVAVSPWDDNVPDQTFTTNHFRLVEIRHGFVPGRNKIEIDVWNGIYQTPDIKHDPNPVALRVEFQAFGRLDRHGIAVEEKLSFTQKL